MNPRALIALVIGLAAGTAIGWLAKRGPSATEPAPQTEQPAAAPVARPTHPAAQHAGIERELETMRALLAAEREKTAALDAEIKSRPQKTSASSAAPREAGLPAETAAFLARRYSGFHSNRGKEYLAFIRARGLSYQQGAAFLDMIDEWKNCRRSETNKYFRGSIKESCEKLDTAMNALLGGDGVLALADYERTTPYRRFAEELSAFAAKSGAALPPERGEELVRQLSAAGVNTEKLSSPDMLRVPLTNGCDVNAAIQSALARSSAEFDKLADAARPSLSAENNALLDQYLGWAISEQEKAATNVARYAKSVPAKPGTKVEVGISASGSSISTSTTSSGTNSSGMSFHSSSGGPFKTDDFFDSFFKVDKIEVQPAPGAAK